MRVRRLWLCGPALVLCAADGFLTLWGQPAVYWRGGFAAVREGNPLAAFAAESGLTPDAARQLRHLGFAVLPGPEIPGGWARLSQAYDTAVLTADPRDVSIRSSTRVQDFVNRGQSLTGSMSTAPCWRPVAGSLAALSS